MSRLEISAPILSPPPRSPPSSAPADTPSHAPTVLIVFTLLILVCFFMGFCFIYLCRCCILSILHNWNFQGGALGGLVGRSDEDSPNNGLDQFVLQHFPTFIYSSVKEYRKHKYGLECAICLLEFEEESWLRLITICHHVFHQECIDLWLLYHKTCPVCRRDLDSLPLKSPDNARTRNNESFTEEDVRIDIKEGEGTNDGDNRGVERHKQVSLLRQGGDLDKHSRAHSTGHSVVLVRESEEVGHEEEEEAEDKYTLRLPDHVRIKLIRGHHYAKSCITYGEMTKREACSNCGFVQELSASTSNKAT